MQRMTPQKMLAPTEVPALGAEGPFSAARPGRKVKVGAGSQNEVSDHGDG
jgi:hypothetical protein